MQVIFFVEEIYSSKDDNNDNNDNNGAIDMPSDHAYTFIVCRAKCLSCSISQLALYSE